MAKSQTWLFRAFALSVTAMLIAACGTGTPTTAPGTTTPGGATAAPTVSAGPQKGGTIYVLTQASSQL